MNRYIRQTVLPTIGEKGQKAIKKSSVLLVGVGGLGSTISQYLVAAGVGTIGLVDADTVSLHNLQRQILYREPQVGLSKVLTAKQSLKNLNSEVILNAYNIQFTAQNALLLTKNYDIIIDGTDNYSTRYLLNDVCVGLNKPLIYGAIAEFYGQVSVFNYQGGATYRCLYPHAKDDNTISPPIGVIGMLPGIIGGIQAVEAIKIMTNIKDTLKNKLFTINLLNLTTSLTTITPDAEQRKIAFSNFKLLK